MEWAKAVTKEVAAVAIAVVAAVCVLVIFGHVDLKDLAVFGTTIIGALVLAQQKTANERGARIEANGNGTLKSMQDKLDAANKTIAQLTARLPEDTPLPKALAEEQSP